MRNLETLIPLAVMGLFAALRYWVLPQIDLDPVQKLFGPLEIAAYAVSVHIYTRRIGWLSWVYILLPVATILWKDIFNYITVAIALVK